MKCVSAVLLRWAAVKRYLSVLILFSLLAFKADAAFAQTPTADPESPEAKQARLAWFKDAKYGLFIHWGLYAIPAGEWKGRQIPGLGEWIMNRAHIPVAEYEQLAKQWNPVKFDADAWVQLAQDAGMKYIVITSKQFQGQPLERGGRDAFPSRHPQGTIGSLPEARKAAWLLLLTIAGLA
ncbi:MAG: hypothetical protein DMG61_04705 [Acidobacteria bacterium]|nr:MAG: hypothetical protein DMG61_04705 [Acidobacteriota bacterium]